ncbi:MAG: MBL fold metallo-hydrolase [Jatrophihabitans sp.]
MVAGWLSAHPRAKYPLVVAHTHAHGDHIAGDGQFAGRADTTVVGTTLPDVQEFFEFTDWPAQVVQFDLGGRALDVTGIPGHHATSIAIFDPWTGFLLTGDTVYPGRFYAREFPDFVASLDRLVEFAGERSVTHVMGCHIEMAGRPGKDYPLGARYQTDEPALQMTTAQLRRIRDDSHRIAGRPGAHSFDDVIIYNGSCTPAMLRLMARAQGSRLRDLVLRRTRR